MNIYGQITWTEKAGGLGSSVMKYLLPKSENDKLDLSKADILNFWWVSDRVGSEPNNFVWWGAIKNGPGKHVDHYPLILEFPNREFTYKNKLYKLVSTPPGRPGNPMTILVDKDGLIVPDLFYVPGTKLKVLFLSRDWESMGWDLVHPAIALQFMEGETNSSLGKVASWQAYMFRNKA